MKKGITCVIYRKIEIKVQRENVKSDTERGNIYTFYLFRCNFGSVFSNYSAEKVTLCYYIVSIFLSSFRIDLLSLYCFESIDVLFMLYNMVFVIVFLYKCISISFFFWTEQLSSLLHFLNIFLSFFFFVSHALVFMQC